jgi:multiple sugar transport system substrate-binding protein
MKFRILYLAIALVLVVTMLAACAQPTPEPPAPEEPAAEEPAAGEPAEEMPEEGGLPPIVVAVWSSPEQENLAKVAEQYTKDTGNEVVVEEIAREAYYDKLTTTFVAGGSDYDVAYIMSDWPPAWVEADGLQDLNQFYEDPNVADPSFSVDIFRPSVDPFEFDGKIFALPSEGDTAWLWYRKDVLEEAGLEVPQTWDELLEVARAVNNPPEMYGMVIGVKPDEAIWDFMYYLFGHGGGILDENNNPIVNNEQGVAALEFYASLLEEGLVPPDVPTYGYNEILTTLQEGKAAMGIEWMAATQTLQDCEQSPKVCKDGETQLLYTKVPGVEIGGEVVRSTGGSQWGWGIPAGAQNAEAGYKFIEYLTGKNGASQWALNGGIPSNTEALSDPAVVAEIPQFELLAEVMPFRQIVPATLVTAEMVNELNNFIVAAVTGEMTAQEALDGAAAKMEELMTEAGYYD